MNIEENVKSIIELAGNLSTDPKGEVRSQIETIAEKVEYSDGQIVKAKLVGVKSAHIEPQFGKNIITFYPPLEMDKYNSKGESMYTSRWLGYVFFQTSEFGTIQVCSAERNFRWRIREKVPEKISRGNFFENANMDEDSRKVIENMLMQVNAERDSTKREPIYEYSITGGYVYNGYFFPSEVGGRSSSSLIKILTYPDIARIGFNYESLGDGTLTAFFNHFQLFE